MSTQPTPPELHRLLMRQMRRFGLSIDTAPDPVVWQQFLHRISNAYDENDQQRYLLERSTAISASELHQLHDRLRWQATHDSLTDLPNRAVFHEELVSLLDQSAPSVGMQFSVLYLDIDDFKLVNDTWGHPSGDAVLAAVAQRLQGCTRCGELVARLAGDEFVVLCPEGRERAIAVAERIVSAVRQPIALADRTLQCTASVGVAVRCPTDTVETLLHRADQALYAAKRTGRGRVVVDELCQSRH